MKKINVDTKAGLEQIKTLNAGDKVLLSGTIYTARDAAHKKLVEILEKKEEMPFELKGAIIYYVGPTPAKANQPIGSAGPTTSYRMDSYAPKLLDEGVVGMIGKGDRNDAVIESIKKNKAVYFAATGGVAALIAKTVTSAEVIAFEELGAEAVRRLCVKEMPLIVAIDSKGVNLYKEGVGNYLRTSREIK